MINIGDLTIDKNEVLRYLGHNMQAIDNELDKLINDTIEECKTLIAPKYIYGEYNISLENEKIIFEETSLVLTGKDIIDLLNNSKSAVIMAVTLGGFIDKKIAFYEKTNLTKALILDSCATTAVEEVCDIIERHIKEKALERDLGITFRYSPGYGDLPLSVQKDFISTLSADKRIGLNTSEHYLLFPRKSVTAIIGLVPKEMQSTKRTCEVCKNYKNCSFRKEGANCGS